MARAIVSVLLSCSTPPTGPIVIVTVKNHALDRLLVSLLTPSDSDRTACVTIDQVARVGNRSEATQLSPALLTHLMKSADAMPLSAVEYKLERCVPVL